MEKVVLKTQILPANQVDANLENALWNVFSKYYDSISREAFHTDLKKKTHVIVLREEKTNLVCGFSTAQIYFSRQNNKKVQIIYSGDTIMEKAYWGRKELHMAFFQLLLTCKLKHPLTPLYWFLISKGYKTYLLVAKNVVNYFPRPSYEPSASEKTLLDLLATEKFGNVWKKDLGVLQFENCPGRLKDGVTPISDKDLQDVHIRFFQEKNPLHSRGDELCCLAKIDRHAVFAFISKQVKKLFATRPQAIPVTNLVLAKGSASADLQLKNRLG